MDYYELEKIVENLKFNERFTIINEDSATELFILRPITVTKNLKNLYDVNKNFQIWLKDKHREFRPNHLRVFIDLNLRARSRPDLKKDLLLAFDNIFYKKDPDTEIAKFENEKFEYYLNSLRIIANLSQLFLIEQEKNYKDSKYDPKSLFYQGWVRQFIDSPREIDNMCMSVCKRQPPTSKYTNKENKKNSKKFISNLPKLWYI